MMHPSNKLWQRLRRLSFTSVLMGYLSSVSATDLLDIYHEALANDTQFKAAYSTYLANAEAVPQALSTLLPQVTISALGSQVRQNVEVSPIAYDNQYNATNWQVNATQTLFNYQAWKMLSQATASAKAAQATFNNAAQNLMQRVANAYLDVLLTQDTLNFAEAKKRANHRHYLQAKHRFQVGLDPITAVYEAKAADDQSTADVITAKNDQINQNEQLRKITNQMYEQVAPLRNGKIPLIRPEPNNIDEWVNTGLRQNFNLLATKYKLDAARENIKAQAAGNWPVFGLQGNTQQIRNNSTNDSFFVPNSFENYNVAVAMNFPIYQGGLVASKTRQAIYEFQVSTENLEQTHRNVVSNSRIYFNNITDGLQKVSADRQTVISRINQLNSTAAQFSAGTRNMVDVTNAQQRLFEAQRQLAADQYRLIKSQIALKYLSGTLNVSDLQEINSWLATIRLNRFAPHP